MSAVSRASHPPCSPAASNGACEAQAAAAVASADSSAGAACPSPRASAAYTHLTTRRSAMLVQREAAMLACAQRRGLAVHITHKWVMQHRLATTSRVKRPRLGLGIYGQAKQSLGVGEGPACGGAPARPLRLPTFCPGTRRPAPAAPPRPPAPRRPARPRWDRGVGRRQARGWARGAALARAARPARCRRGRPGGGASPQGRRCAHQPALAHFHGRQLERRKAHNNE